MFQPESAFNNLNDHTRKESLMRPSDVKKLLRVEGNEMKRLGLIQGFLGGVLVCFLLLILAGAFIWKNPEIVAEKALDYVVSNYLQDLFKGFPDAYVSRHRNEIHIILDDFTNAAAANKISQRHYKSIGKSLLSAMSDKKITWHEMDGVLALLKKAAKISGKRMERKLKYYRKVDRLEQENDVK